MKICFYIFFTCSVHFVVGQSVSDTLKIKQVEIIGNKIPEKELNLIVIQPNILQANSLKNLATLLEDNTAITIKSWGYGGLAIPAFRGTSPNHTRVFWNGIPLNSPMNGQLDFSSLPVSNIQKMSLVYGGNSSKYGSGAIGGVILLDNEEMLNPNLIIKFEQAFASFNNTSSALNVGFGKKQIHYRLSANHSYGKNDFEFFNNQLFKPEVQKMQNSEQESKGLTQELYWKLNSFQSLIFRSWYQNTQKNLPGTLLNTNNRTELGNRTWRNMMAYNWVKGKNNLEFKSAWTHENLLYKENIIGFNELSIADQFFSSIENKFEFSIKTNINLKFENSMELGVDKVFLKNVNRNIQNIIFGFNSEILKSKVFFNFRKAFLIQNQPPFCYQIGFKKLLFSTIGFSLKGSTARNYTLPTLNDLYWSPGGNPNLKPEDAFNQELGFILEKKNKVQYSFEFNAYYGMISNWIIWLPSSFGYWSPKNFKKVNNKGLEAICNYNFPINSKIKMGLNGVYTYTISTNLESIQTGDQSTNKQLIYIPYNVIKGNVFLEWKNFKFNFQNSFTGFRYTTFDNSKFLPSYNLTKIGVSKVFKKSQQSFLIDLNIENIFNVSYQSVAYFAMPGRIYSIKFQYYFNKK